MYLNICTRVLFQVSCQTQTHLVLHHRQPFLKTCNKQTVPLTSRWRRRFVCKPVRNTTHGDVNMLSEAAKSLNSFLPHLHLHAQVVDEVSGESQAVHWSQDRIDPTWGAEIHSIQSIKTFIYFVILMADETEMWSYYFQYLWLLVWTPNIVDATFWKRNTS